jgi:RNA polymerase sigma-70 factor (ECF subfamily)
VTDAPTNDQDLVRRMLAGEEEAFDRFFEGYFPRLYRFALSRLDGDEDTVEEVVQNTLCRAVSGLKSYRGESALFTWLCTICRHEISAHYKRSGRRAESSCPIEDSPEVRAALESLSASLDADPESRLHSREVARMVQVTLDALPGPYGDALEWKYAQGLSVKEVALRLDLGLKAAESLLTRARQAFRDGFTAVSRAPRAYDAAAPTVKRRDEE